MRRGSVIGPLILIGLGILFLFRNLWPDIPLVDMISRFWPFLLIAWGGIRLLEILFWSMTGKPLPRNGVSGGEWALIFVICIVGATMYTAHNAPSWFPSGRAWRRVVAEHGRKLRLYVRTDGKALREKLPHRHRELSRQRQNHGDR